MNYVKNYWAIYKAVDDMIRLYGLSGTEKFISACVERVEQDADVDWNEDDVRIAIRNTLNELLENL